MSSADIIITICLRDTITVDDFYVIFNKVPLKMRLNVVSHISYFNFLQTSRKLVQRSYTVVANSHQS